MTASPATPTIPSEAYLYFPQASDMKTPQGDRLIFDGNTKFDPSEHSKISEFKQYSQKHHYTLSPMWTDNLILRFLYASGFKMDKTLQSVKDHTLWRGTSLPVQVDEQLQQYLNSGILYMHGRDSKFRPIVVFNINMIDPKKFDYGLITKYLTFWFEFIINQCMLPGQIESWVFIVNLKDIKVSTSTAMSLKKVFSYLQDNYKCRLQSLFMINAAASVYLPWKIIQKFLDDVTTSKINFYKTSAPTALFNRANPEQVEKQFGGSAPNLTQYWPLQTASNNFFVTKDDEKMLISVDTYRKLFEEDKLQDMKINEAFISIKSITKNISGETTPGEATPGAGSSTDLSSGHISIEDIAERDDGTEAQEVNMSFLSISEDSSEVNEETDYTECMNEGNMDRYSSRITDFRASFIANASTMDQKVY